MFHRIAREARSAAPSRRGAVGKGCLIALAVAAALAVLLAVVGIGGYNGLASSQENAKAKWAEIDNQYKRRFDLVPNLVETVKGAADFERGTLEAVTEARASVGRAQLPANLPTDSAQLQAYLQAQQSLGGALSRLMVVAEQYPALRATENFKDLQSQLEGTENRIAVARRDYIDAVKTYNTKLATFPSNVIGGFFRFERLSQLEVDASERAVPKVDFGGKK
ncbi:MAG: LemA family protein [Planctomycetes bacterium]|nr:LemA family protein [Planctomycetota bacterium]